MEDPRQTNKKGPPRGYTKSRGSRVTISTPYSELAWCLHINAHNVQALAQGRQSVGWRLVGGHGGHAGVRALTRTAAGGSTGVRF